MQVKILKPLSSGFGKRFSQSKKPEFWGAGKVIDFENDLNWPEGENGKPKANVKKEAEQLADAGYIEILPNQPNKMQVKK